MSSQRMLIIDAIRGLTEVEVDDAEARRLIGSHHSAIARYLDGKGADALTAFAATSIEIDGETYELEADLERIVELAYAGDLGFDDIYVS